MPSNACDAEALSLAHDTPDPYQVYGHSICARKNSTEPHRQHDEMAAHRMGVKQASITWFDAALALCIRVLLYNVAHESLTGRPEIVTPASDPTFVREGNSQCYA